MLKVEVAELLLSLVQLPKPLSCITLNYREKPTPQLNHVLRRCKGQSKLTSNDNMCRQQYDCETPLLSDEICQNIFDDKFASEIFSLL